MKSVYYAVSICAGLIMLVSGVSLQAAQDRYGLKAPNGVSFSEIRGYEGWQVVAPSYRTDKNEVRIILANSIMIDAYRQGVPENGRPFPDGSIIVKLAWSERKNPVFPAALEPDVLQRVEMIVKDSKRFPDTAGWGYARFIHEPKTGIFSVYGKDAAFAQECFQCHTLVKTRDYIFTRYPQR